MGDFYLLQIVIIMLVRTGGEERVTLKINEIPSHSHNYDRFHYDITVPDDTTPGGGRYCPFVRKDYDFYRSNSATYSGGGCSHNNMPPYLTANCWQRIA